MATRLARGKRFARLRCEALEHRDTPAAVTVIDFGAGFAQAGPLRGVPIGYAAPDLLLTDGPFQARAVWAPDRVHVGAFHTSFVFRQDGPAGRVGDGFTFALTGDDEGIWQPGAAGAGLGYQGLADSVAIKFDLVDNAGEGGHSVGVFTGGAEPTMPAVRLDDTPIHLHAQHPIRADIAYDGAVLTLTLTDTTAPERTWTHAFDVDIPAAVGSPTAYAGFTAGTGELFARQAIDSWTFAEVVPDRPAGRPPEIVVPPQVSWVGTSTVALTARVADDGGADNLTYTWGVVSAPNGGTRQLAPWDSDPARPIALAHLDMGYGLYTFRLTVRDAEGQAAVAEVRYNSGSIPTRIEVAPETSTVPAGGTVRFVATEYDEGGNPVADTIAPAWAVVRGPGTIDEAGRYTAPVGVSGLVTVRATIPVVQNRGMSLGYAAAEATVWIRSYWSGTTLYYPGFVGSSVPAYGSAHVTADRRLRLTDGPHQAGSAYFPDPVHVAGFVTRFQFRVGSGPSGSYGDGLTFVLQNAGRGAVGAAGGGLGYEGIADSVAVKFDLVDNAGEGADSIGVFTGGDAPTVPSGPLTAGAGERAIQLHAGGLIDAKLSYAAGVLRVELKDLEAGGTFDRSYAVDIPAAVGGSGAYVGFTAGTGELFAPIDIWHWEFVGTDNWDPGSIPPLWFPHMS